jgi:hypothetical protein
MTPKPPDNPSISTIHRESERAVRPPGASAPPTPTDRTAGRSRPPTLPRSGPRHRPPGVAAPLPGAPRRRRERDIGEPTPPWQEMILTDRSQQHCTPVTPHAPARSTPPTRAPRPARAREQAAARESPGRDRRREPAHPPAPGVGRPESRTTRQRPSTRAFGAAQGETAVLVAERQSHPEPVAAANRIEARPRGRQDGCWASPGGQSGGFSVKARLRRALTLRAPYSGLQAGSRAATRRDSAAQRASG